MTAAFWDDEPTNEHTLDCDIWTTNDKPCNCRDLPRFTTAQLLDQLCPVTDRDGAVVEGQEPGELLMARPIDIKAAS